MTATLDLSVTADWSPIRRQRAAERLSTMRARQRIVEAADHPAALAKMCDDSYVITPAVELVSRTVERVLRTRRRRLIITAPPQEFKSYLCAVWTPIRALQLHPDWRVMLLTYADGLAEEHSILARSFVTQYGSGVIDPLTGRPLPDRLGISLSEEKATAGNWRIREGTGGLLAAGRDATITGRRADLIIIDDPYKNMQEADSEAVRHKVDAWYRSVAQTRLAPGASIIIIQTRWHPNDLAGTLIAEDQARPPEQRQWRYINIPAVAHPAIFDSLGREPGEVLESARGRTRDDFEATERDVGKRVWNALYQGSPTPPEGGLFSGAWFDEHRLADQPEQTRVRIVAVDPAESGHGDEAGVLAGALLPDGRVALTHDRSGQMTSDQWADAAVDLAVEVRAAEINVEAYTAGDTYVAVVRRKIADRIALLKAKMRALKREGKPLPEYYLEQIHYLTGLSQRVRKWRETGDAVARSAILRQGVEVGTTVVVGHELAVMEQQARLWQVGQHQPDRVAAAVIIDTRLRAMLGRQAHIAKPAGSPVGGPGRSSWLERKVG